MAIEPLKRVIVNEDENGTQTTRLPNNQEMMDKINELIKHVGNMDARMREERFKKLFK